jgi:RNA polymerase sigma factor (sigma-70 family)
LQDRARHQWVATHVLPHEGEVRAWLRRHVHSLSPSDIDDLIQDAYARLWSVEFSHITNARGYLFAIIRNLLLENARRARIVPMERLGEIEMLRIPSEEPGPDRRVSARQELEQCRRAFQLQKFQCLSQRQIALKMNIAERTVEKYLAIALGRVLDALKQDGEGAMGRPESGTNGHVSKQSTD